VGAEDLDMFFTDFAPDLVGQRPVFMWVTGGTRQASIASLLGAPCVMVRRDGSTSIWGRVMDVIEVLEESMLAKSRVFVASRNVWFRRSSLSG
jgi:hypothetical protein